jgi:fructokinase
LPELLPLIRENMALANIIKGSDEDFDFICNAKSSAEAFEFLNDKNKILIYSRGKNGVDFIGKNKFFHLNSKKISPVSTIGAGDNFNAGIAYGLISHDVFSISSNFSEELWKEILTYGIDFASEVCLSYDNYIPESYALDYLNKINQKL